MKRSKSINIVAENRVIYAKSDLLKGYMSRLKKAISYSMLRRYDLLIAESEASREFLVDIGCPTDKIKLILHGVDLSIFQPSIVQSKTEDRRLKVLYAGGFIESKGYRYLSEALDSGRLSAFDFTIISFGSVIESKRFDHKRNVKLIPTLSYYEMVMLYQSVDIVLVPSIVTEFDAERSPNVVIEAMACGRTVIATNIGGIPSYLGDAGILIPSCNSEAIVEALLRLEKNPSLVDYYGSRAAKRAVDLFDITKYAEALYLMSAKMVGKETALVCN
ncbi:MAG: glycosyltransferase family 4 protein [Thaumarchaeota archaeon]|nr:glycosyltransferase family 4 protein [Nitrososphaerota archaeon]